MLIIQEPLERRRQLLAEATKRKPSQSRCQKALTQARMSWSGSPRSLDLRASSPSARIPSTNQASEAAHGSSTRSTGGRSLLSPNFVDYLFLAFNTSTTFSPTDVPVLARWAKVLMMLQSLLSLLIIAPSRACRQHSINANTGRDRNQGAIMPYRSVSKLIPFPRGKKESADQFRFRTLEASHQTPLIDSISRTASPNSAGRKIFRLAQSLESVYDHVLEFLKRNHGRKTPRSHGCRD